MFRTFVASYLEGVAACHHELSVEKLERVLEIVLRAYEQQRTIFILGNGGSATTASHMACDLGKGTSLPGRPRLRVISLADSPALLTAWANDASYELVFKEQLENLLQAGDVVIGLSTSENSPNVLQAIQFARERGAVTVGFIGCGGGKLRALVDADITVSSTNCGQVEEFHLALNHIFSQYLRQYLNFRDESGMLGRLGCSLKGSHMSSRE